MPKKIQHGGLQTFKQFIGNCSSHAESRCIYRIFKYLQEKHNNIFKCAPDDSPFKDFNIIHNTEHVGFYKHFITLQQLIDPINKNEMNFLNILKGLVDNTNDYTLHARYINESFDKTPEELQNIAYNTNIGETNKLTTFNDIIIECFKMKLNGIVSENSIEISINYTENSKGTETIKGVNEQNIDNSINNILYDTITKKAWNDIEKVRTLIETIKSKNYNDLELAEKITDSFFDGVKIDIQTTYESMLQIQKYQKDIYFTLLPILTYYKYILKKNDEIIKIQMVDKNELTISNDINKMEITEEDKYQIIDNNNNEITKEYFYELNEVYFNQKLNDKNEDEKKTHLNKQISNFKKLISLIPKKYILRKHYYNNIDSYIEDKNEKQNRLFGVFSLSVDLANKIINTNHASSHAVTIESIEKNKEGYHLCYKNSWGVKFGDEGRDNLEIKKSELDDYYTRYLIDAWVLEEKNDENDKIENAIEKAKKKESNIPSYTLNIGGVGIKIDATKDQFTKIQDFLNYLRTEKLKPNIENMETQIKQIANNNITVEDAISNYKNSLTQGGKRKSRKSRKAKKSKKSKKSRKKNTKKRNRKTRRH
jgi:hypothetical protein